MAMKSSIPVRFSAETMKRLEAVRAKSGVPVAQLIRVATEERLDLIERSQKIEIALGDSYPPGAGSIVLTDDKAEMQRAIASADDLDEKTKRKGKGRK